MTKTIKFPTKNFFKEGGKDSTIPFMTKHSVEDLLKNHLIKPNEVVLKNRDIKICFNYPFKQPFIFTFSSPNGDGFTRGQLAEIIINQYYQMYREEDETIQEKPVLSLEERKQVSFLINRNETDGKYGIWGHDMDDLSLNSMSIDKDGIWHLSIDS